MRCARKSVCLLLCVSAVLSLAAATCAQANSGLISNLRAQRFGLTRAWFSQAQLDVSRTRVERAVLDGDKLFVLTTAGVLQAMNAETGKTEWVARIGNPNYPSLGPGVGSMYVAVVNGSTLTVMRRDDGFEVLRRQLGGGAGGAPAVSEEHAYVPMFSGRLEGYSLVDSNERPTNYASTGRIFDAPLTTSNSVIWPTDRGYLYVSDSESSAVRYRFQSSGRITGEPAVLDGVLYAASAAGYIYALNERTGDMLWRHSTGASIIRSPVTVGTDVMVVTEHPMLHSLDTITGEQHWETPGISQLLGVSKTRVYGIDSRGHISILDRASGVNQGSLETSTETIAVVNADTDRLYLVSETGLVQCLHEIGSDQPYVHAQQAAPAMQKPDEVEEGEAPALEPDDEPPAEADEPEEPNVFESAEEGNPFDDVDDSNPFEF